MGLVRVSDVRGEVHPQWVAVVKARTSASPGCVSVCRTKDPTQPFSWSSGLGSSPFGLQAGGHAAGG